MDRSNKGNTLVWILVAVVVVILVLVGLYLYQGRKTTTPATYQQTQAEDNLEAEVSAIDVNGLDADFDALDKDLQSL